jgi:PHD/YefM family antitoxin component YafN of YafNO toxin-antitoxin module
LLFWDEGLLAALEKFCLDQGNNPRSVSGCCENGSSETAVPTNRSLGEVGKASDCKDDGPVIASNQMRIRFSKRRGPDMIDVSKGIDSLTNFKRNTPAFLDRLQESGQPMVLTINGKAKLVVQDASSYQQLLETIDRLEAIEGIRRGLSEMKAGKGKPLDRVDKAIRKKHRIPRDA